MGSSSTTRACSPRKAPTLMRATRDANACNEGHDTRHGARVATARVVLFLCIFLSNTLWEDKKKKGMGLQIRAAVWVDRIRDVAQTYVELAPLLVRRTSIVHARTRGARCHSYSHHVISGREVQEEAPCPVGPPPLRRRDRY